MIQAAGILYIAADGRALFLKRGGAGDHAGEWCIPGGKIEDGETAEAAARREFKEETGHDLTVPLTLWSRRIAADAMPAPRVTVPTAMPPAPEIVDFSTFIARGGDTFEPTPDDEHDGFAWAPPASPPEPLHPGCRVVVDKLTMDELGIARAIAAGNLTSPQRYENVWLFALRITGTGTAYRKKLDEFVYRRPENYLTDEFLARCNGLTVIVEHPKKNALDSNEFSDRVVGSILLPYIAGDEVWGIAKIYDDGTARMMIDEKMSTSPAVVFRDPSVNSRMELEDGSKLLIEGKPSLLDHLAICERGVWDKGEDPSGVRTDSTGDTKMTPEELKAKADAEAAEREAKEKADAEAKAKADADAGTKIDKVLAHLDSMSTKIDSVCGRMDSFEAKEKEHADAEAKAKADAEEAERTKTMSAEEKKADKARKDAEEAEKKEKADAESKEKADAEERKKIADSVSEVKTRIDAVQAMLPKARSDDERAALADAQAKADSVYHAFGDSAPRVLDGESLGDYRRRLLGKLKVHSPQWKDIDLAGVNDKVLDVAEAQVFTDSMAAANHPTDLPEGQMRAVTRVDPSTGIRMTTFHGKSSFIRGMTREPRYVTRFLNEKKSA